MIRKLLDRIRENRLKKYRASREASDALLALMLQQVAQSRHPEQVYTSTNCILATAADSFGTRTYGSASI